MDNIGAYTGENEKPLIYLATMGDKAYDKAFEIVNELRLKGVIAQMDLKNRGIKAQFKYADKIGAKFVGVIGETELLENAVKIKEMESGNEQMVNFCSVFEYITKC